MHELLENAIEAAQEAQQAIIAMEANNRNRATLDASYNALSETIRQLSKLLQTEVVE
jgi:hypothetical protein